MKKNIVFVVDDSPIVLAVASAGLESAGFEIRTMSSWEEVDQALLCQRPDLILMDVNMPDVTGDSVIGFFKATRGIEDIPILLYSDLEEEELAQRSAACAADGFVCKAWGMDGLVNTVTLHLQRHNQ